MGNNKSFSYLPFCGTAEAAQRKAVKGILAWADMSLPEHRADADEPADPIESIGFSAVRYDVVVEDPAEKEEEEEKMEEVSPLPPYRPFTETRVFQSMHDALYDLYLSVSTARGRRMSAELRFVGRAGF